MSLPRDFWEQLPLRTDAELYDLLAHPSDYRPEARVVFRAELSKRNLPPEKAAELESAIQAREAAAAAKAQGRSSWPTRVFVSIFCVAFLGALVAVDYQDGGYKMSASDFCLALVAGVFIHLLQAALLHPARYAGPR